jgi:Flp pilus assembly protein TadD
VFVALFVFQLNVVGQRKQTGSQAIQTVNTQNEVAALLKAGKLDEAEVLIRDAIASAPQNADLHTILGVVLDQKGQIADAEKEYRAATMLDPKSPSARVNLGVMLARTQRTTEAIEAFEQALSLAPNHAEATRNLANNRR